LTQRQPEDQNDVTSRHLTNPLSEYTSILPRSNANRPALVPIGRPSRHRLARLSPLFSEAVSLSTTDIMI